MNLSELKHGESYRCRWGRAGESAPNWNEWQSVPLFIARREQPLPKGLRGRARGYANVGDITTLTIETTPWAEYSQADYQGDGVFLAEDFYLQIEALNELKS